LTKEDTKVWGLQEAVESGNRKILDITLKEKFRALQKNIGSLGLEMKTAGSGHQDIKSDSSCSQGLAEATHPSCKSPPSPVGLHLRPTCMDFCGPFTDSTIPPLPLPAGWFSPHSYHAAG